MNKFELFQLPKNSRIDVVEPLYIWCMPFKSASNLLGVSIADLVENSPETFAMIHLYCMAQFVQQDIVDKLVGEQNKIYA